MRGRRSPGKGDWGHCSETRRLRIRSQGAPRLRQGGPRRRAGRGRQQPGGHLLEGRVLRYPRRGERLLLQPASEPGRGQACVPNLEPPEHAVGRMRAMGGRGGGGRLTGRGEACGWRPGRVDRPARVGPRRRALLRLGSGRLVEPVQVEGRDGGGGLPDGGRVRGP